MRNITNSSTDTRGLLFSFHIALNLIPLYLNLFVHPLKQKDIGIHAVRETSVGNNPNCNGKLECTAQLDKAGATKHWQRFNIRNNKIRTHEHHVRVPLRMHLICAMFRERMSPNSTETKITTILIEKYSFIRKTHNDSVNAHFQSTR